MLRNLRTAMKQFTVSFWLWMPATLKAGLMTLSAMGAAFLANVNGKTTADLANWGWLEYTILCVTVSGAGIITLISFLDQTIQVIKSKASDTMLWGKADDK